MTDDEWEWLGLSLVAPTLICAVFAGGLANQSPGVLLHIACYLMTGA